MIETGRAMDGHEFWEWIHSQPDATEIKSRVLALGHKCRYSPRIWSWSPLQVESVREKLAQAPPEWGGTARHG